LNGLTDIGTRKGEVIDDAPVGTDDLHAIVGALRERGQTAGSAR
jgi:hypothetical protein